MTLAIRQTIPILRIFDEAKARAFYVDFLGGRVEWEHRFEPSLPLYMQVSLAGATFHLSEHHGDGCPGSTVFLWVEGLDAYQQDLLAKRYPFLRPGLEDAPWGRTMELIDPFGNRLRLSEKDPAKDAAP